MVAKNGGKRTFGKKCLITVHRLCGPIFFPQIALSCTVSEMNGFLFFMLKFKMATKKWRENDFPNIYFIKSFFRTFQVIIWASTPISCDFSDWSKYPDTIFRNFSHSYCINVTNLKRIHRVDSQHKMPELVVPST